MSPRASSPKCNPKSGTLRALRDRATITFALALAFLVGMIWDGIESNYAAWITAAIQSSPDSNVVVLSFAAASFLEDTDIDSTLPDEVASQSDRRETCDATDMVALARLDLPTDDNELMPPPVSPPIHNEIFEMIRSASAGMNNRGVDLVSFARQKVLPKFASAYRSVLKLAALMELPRVQDDATLARSRIIGTVSTYNPYREGKEEGGAETASGEFYDPAAWTAAIQTDLRNQFGGVRYGKLYQPTFALVESGEKQVIVRINDVGRLRPGRVLDLNERTMRYFDPFLTRGIIDDVRITLLPGEDWTPGPVGEAYAIEFAVAQRPYALAPAESIVSDNWEPEPEFARPVSVHLPASIVSGDVHADAIPSKGG